MTDSSGWSHETAFAALRRRYGGQNPKHGRYAYLYAQTLGKNSAVLYEPDSVVKHRPLQLRADGASFRPDVFAALEPFIEFKHQETKPAGFTSYAVTDWDGFARALGLPSSLPLP